LSQSEQEIIGYGEVCARTVIINTNEDHAMSSVVWQIVGKGADCLPYAIRI